MADSSRALVRDFRQAPLPEKRWILQAWHRLPLQVLVQLLESRKHGLLGLAAL
jgi:hypothetical protein